MKDIFKKLASKLPIRFQQELKRAYFRRQISTDTFKTTEKEYELLDKWVSPGDWVIDVGANIGHYCLKLSNIVGNNGRIIAFEPVPQTFELLAANVALSSYANITLVNAAASDAVSVKGIDIPKFNTGLDNFYMAHICNLDSDLKILCIPIDSLQLPNRVTLVKIDAEGHDFQVIEGMRKLLERDHPTLIVEDHSTEIMTYLGNIGYKYVKITGSHNGIFRVY